MESPMPKAKKKVEEKSPLPVLENIRTILTRGTYAPAEFQPVLEAIAFIEDLMKQVQDVK